MWVPCKKQKLSNLSWVDINELGRIQFKSKFSFFLLVKFYLLVQSLDPSSLLIYWNSSNAYTCLNNENNLLFTIGSKNTVIVVVIGHSLICLSLNLKATFGKPSTRREGKQKVHHHKSLFFTSLL